MWGYGPGSGYGMMGGYGYGMGPIGIIIWIAILTAVIVAIVWLVRSLAGTGSHQQPSLPRRSSGLDILEERYARGEINRDEYLEKKKDIGG